MYEFSLYQPIYSLPTIHLHYRQGERKQGYSREGKVCGAPAFRGGPALFICYLLYAINTLGYSPFCFRIASQILLLF